MRHDKSLFVEFVLAMPIMAARSQHVQIKTILSDKKGKLMSITTRRRWDLFVCLRFSIGPS